MGTAPVRRLVDYANGWRPGDRIQTGCRAFAGLDSGRSLPSGLQVIHRQVSLRSLTTFFRIASRLGDVGGFQAGKRNSRTSAPFRFQTFRLASSPSGRARLQSPQTPSLGPEPAAPSGRNRQAERRKSQGATLALRLCEFPESPAPFLASRLSSWLGIIPNLPAPPRAAAQTPARPSADRTRRPRRHTRQWYRARSAPRSRRSTPGYTDSPCRSRP